MSFKWILDDENKEIMVVKTRQGWREVQLGKMVEQKSKNSLPHRKEHPRQHDGNGRKGDGGRDVERRRQFEYKPAIKPDYGQDVSPRLSPPDVVKAGGQKWFPSMVRIVQSIHY